MYLPLTQWMSFKKHYGCCDDCWYLCYFAYMLPLPLRINIKCSVYLQIKYAKCNPKWHVFGKHGLKKEKKE